MIRAVIFGDLDISAEVIFLSLCHRSCEIDCHSLVVNRVGKVHFNAGIEPIMFR